MTNKATTSESRIVSKNNDDHPWRTEGLPEFSKTNKQNEKPPSKHKRWVFIVGIILAWLVVFSGMTLGQRLLSPVLDIPYNELYTQLANDNVKEIFTKGYTIEGKLKKPSTYDDEKYEEFSSERPIWADDDMAKLVSEHDVKVTAESTIKQQNIFVTLLLSILPIAVIIGFYWWFMKRMMGRQTGGLFASTKHKPVEPGKIRVTFNDVAGIDEVEDQLREVVDMLRNPEKYTRLGAKIPRGILLEGGPGTGKTLLARATAGEADVPFFSISASEIGGILAGKGANDIKSLFEEARKVAPAIIFIDEIDAIGRSRAKATSITSNEDREQTLNQILTEMDGFSGAEGIVVIAATNLAEVLDAALTRPGRFDRTITVAPPDLKGREAILKVHVRGVTLGDDVDLAAMAKSTPGLTGAELANLVNEATLEAARKERDAVTMRDFTQALETIQLGIERAVMMDQEERERTAWHEAGHALLGMIRKGADPVRKISIIPRGRALGVTLSTPESDRYGYDEEYLRGRLIGALGGMAAEKIVYGVVTTGAESDLDHATNIARAMFGRWGMSPTIGPIQVYPREGDPRAYGVSEQLLHQVDVEVQKLLSETLEEACRLLREHADQHKALVDALLEKETLDEDEAYEIAGITPVKKANENAEAAEEEAGAAADSADAEAERD